jgi:hypothetical protein
VLPELMAAYGQPVVAMASAVTMYGGVLYSMLLPMALLALLREEAHERVVRQSLTDYLTGLGNRQCFFEQGTRMIEDQGGAFPCWPLTWTISRRSTTATAMPRGTRCSRPLRMWRAM